ncbi:hypothetical protein [Saccharothrix obliqua]|uniref:hypothetical protein n=1 Tax=Saccharothrix obliqua TaxID=2861747 RepID=UPI001C5F4668|nr:hypothetical protein [Saccharothrix obliqua]MBW4719953.1 hypothetical protein [Saccharothrix obliqua]
MSEKITYLTVPPEWRPRWVLAVAGTLVLAATAGTHLVTPATVSVLSLLFVRWNRRRRGLLDQDGNLSAVEPGVPVRSSGGRR